MQSPYSQLLERNKRPRSNRARRARRNPYLVQSARTARAQAIPRLTVGWEAEAKMVKGQEDKTPRRRRRRQKQLWQWKWPTMQIKYPHLPACPTMLKLQMPSMFPSPNLVHALIAVQANTSAMTVMHSSTILWSETQSTWKGWCVDWATKWHEAHQDHTQSTSVNLGQPSIRWVIITQWSHLIDTFSLVFPYTTGFSQWLGNLFWPLGEP